MINDPFGIMNSNYDLRNSYAMPNYNSMRNRSVEELKQEEMQISMRLLEIQREKQRLLETTPMSGPTPKQLNEYPALKSIWDELQTTMKMCGI